MKERIKNTKGITLVALIITIIVLLILAMVSINLVINGGIIGKAQNTVNDYKIAEEKEQIQLGYSDYQLALSMGQEEDLSVEGATVTEDSTNGWKVKFGTTENEYTLSADGKTITGPTKTDSTSSEISITSTVLNKTSLSLALQEDKDTAELLLTVNPNNATEIPTWTSSNTNIVTVTPASDGRSAIVKGIAYGNATISVTGGAQCSVFVDVPACCFDAGSQVLMANGKTKNIEEVKDGDMVMSLNEDTGEFVSQEVKKIITKHNSDDLVYVNLSNGERIGMRAYHPLLTTEGYKSLRPDFAETTMEAGEKVELLRVGDTLVGYKENVAVISIEERPEIENYNTYNLAIEGYHNYIVNGIVVHNAVEEPCVNSMVPVTPVEEP